MTPLRPAFWYTSPAEGPVVKPLEVELIPMAEIARGATSVLRLARLAAPWGDLEVGHEVAIKELRPELFESDPARSALETEARALAQISHPNVARLIDTLRANRGGPGSATTGLVLDYLPGSDLAQELASTGALALEAWWKLSAELAAGLTAIHAAGWRHGDIKPENIRRDRAGQAVWVDLGFASRLEVEVEVEVEDEVEDEESTEEPRRPGTLAYRSPEEIRGGPGSEESDLFSLGIVLYELATGQHPFLPVGSTSLRRASASPARPSGEDRARDAAVSGVSEFSEELIVRLYDARVPAPSDRRPMLPPWVDLLILELLSLDPGDRPAARKVARILENPSGSRWWRRHRDRVRAGGSALPRREGQGRMTFAGRVSQLASLQSAFDGSLRAGGALFLEGPAGVGKSRLAHEAGRRARVLAERPPILLSSRCFEVVDGQPGQPIRDLLLQWLGLERGAPIGSAQREALAELLAARAVDELAEAWNAPPDEVAPMALTEGLASWLIALGQCGPLIVMIDELEWAGSFTLNVLSRLGEDLPQTEILLLLMRGGAADGLQTKTLSALRRRLPGPAGAPEAEVLKVGPFEETEVNVLVNRVFAASAPRLRLARVLWTRSQGLPAHLAEILGDLRRLGQVRELPSGRLELLIAPEAVPRPESLVKRTQRRIRSMRAADRKWLGRLAVLGGTLTAPFVHEVFPEESVSAIDACMTGLVQDNWLRRSGKGYRFRRPEARRAIYETLGKQARKQLHRAAADALRRSRGGVLNMARAFPLAFHLRAAGEHRELVELLPRVVRRALRHGHPQRVHRMCRWGLEALDQIEEKQGELAIRFALLEAAADAADRLGSRRMQREWLDQLSEYPLDPERDPEACGRVYLLHGRYSMSTGRYGDARGQLHNAYLLFDKAGAQAEACESLRYLARVQIDVGNMADARKFAHQAGELAQPGAASAQVEIVLALADLLEDRYDDAIYHVERGRSQLRGPRTIESNAILSALILVRSRIYRALGRPRRSMVAARRAVHLAREAGERRLEVLAQARLGGLLLGSDRAEEAQALLRDACLMAEECENRRALALSTLWLATMLCEEDDPDGPALLERARSIAATSGLGRIETLATSLLARAALIRAAPGPALELSQSATELLERYGSELPDRIVVLGTHAMILRRAGETARATRIERQLLRRIRSVNDGIASTITRARQRRACYSLMRGVATTEGPIYPRVDYPWLRKELE